MVPQRPLLPALLSVLTNRSCLRTYWSDTLILKYVMILHVLVFRWQNTWWGRSPPHRRPSPPEPKWFWAQIRPEQTWPPGARTNKVHARQCQVSHYLKGPALLKTTVGTEFKGSSWLRLKIGTMFRFRIRGQNTEERQKDHQESWMTWCGCKQT